MQRGVPRQRLRFATVVTVAALGACALGCGGGPRWAVVRSSGPPSALRRATSISVLIDASHTTVDGTLLAALASEEQADVVATLQSLLEGIRAELVYGVTVPVRDLTETPARDEARLIVRVLSIRRGWRGPVAAQSELYVQLAWQMRGEITDVIELSAWSSAGTGRSALRSPGLWSVEGRMVLIAQVLGRAAADFFVAEQSRR